MSTKSRQGPTTGNATTGEKFKNITLGISGILSSLLIPLVGFYYAERQKDKEIDKGFVELGIKILSENPTAQNKPLREWAVALVNNYSDVKLSSTAEQLILEKLPLVTSGDRSLAPQALDKLQTEGFLLGTTVSRFNADIDYAALKSRQIRFVYVKASQGETIVDAGMEQNVREANKNEMLIGLYHLFEPKADPIKQAENFVAQLKKQKWDLPPVVDCEIFNGQLPQDYSDRVFQFIQRLQGLTNEKPIIYANTPFADQHFDKRFSTYPIFLARFITSSTSTSIPIPPKWWTTVTFWHLTESVNDPVLSHLDIVAFKGNGAGLKALLADNRVVQPAN